MFNLYEQNKIVDVEHTEYIRKFNETVTNTNVFIVLK